MKTSILVIVLMALSSAVLAESGCYLRMQQCHPAAYSHDGTPPVDWIYNGSGEHGNHKNQ